MEVEGIKTKYLMNNATVKVREDADDARLRKACADFEAIFLNMLFKQMKASTAQSGLFPASIERNLYESMFFEKAAEQISRGRGTGIGRMLYEQLKTNR